MTGLYARIGVGVLVGMPALIWWWLNSGSPGDGRGYLVLILATPIGWAIIAAWAFALGLLLPRAIGHPR